MIRMTWRNLCRQPMRTMLTALGVAIGVIACAVGCVCGVVLARLAALMPVARQFVDPVFGVYERSPGRSVSHLRRRTRLSIA